MTLKKKANKNYKSLTKASCPALQSGHKAEHLRRTSRLKHSKHSSQVNQCKMKIMLNFTIQVSKSTTSLLIVQEIIFFFLNAAAAA